MNRTELRCKCCKTLLGTEDDDGVTIQRGGMQVTVPHPPTVTIVCYRCGHLNLFTLAAGRTPDDGQKK
jgi:RNase P subunit RPR2